MHKIKEKPNPGSEEAIKQGCLCAIIDNHFGKGRELDGVMCWWITEDCPLHGTKK